MSARNLLPLFQQCFALFLNGKLLGTIALSFFLAACGEPPPEDDIPPNRLVILNQPTGSLAAGTEIPLQLEIVDFLNQRIVAGGDATAAVTVSMVSGTGTIFGTTTVNAVAGVIDFTGTGITIGALGTKSLVVTKERTPLSPPIAVPLNNFDVTHGSAALVAYNGQPVSPTVAGTEIASEISILDTYGNLVTTGPDATATITLSLQSGTGALAGGFSLPASGGVANFAGQNVTIALEGFKTIRATKVDTTGSGGTPSVFVDSNSFEIASPAAHHLSLTTQPVDPTPAGAEIGLVVEIQNIINMPMTSGPDATANVTASLISGSGSLLGTVTVVAVNGVADFTGSSMHIDLAGAKVLRLTKEDTSGSGGTASFSIDTTTFNIVNGPADHLTYITQPFDPTTSLAEIATVIEIRDVFENIVTVGADAIAPINVTLQSGTGTITGSAAFTAVAGIIDFSGRSIGVDLVDGKTLRITKADTSGSGGTASLQIDSNSFNIVHGPASQIAILTEPVDPTIAGGNIITEFEIRDTAGNVVDTGVDATANVSLSLQSGTGALGGTVSLPAAAGVASFTAGQAVNIDLVGAKILRATKADTSGSGGTAALFADTIGFNIVHAPASQIIYTTQPADPTNAYEEIATILEIQDTYGNVITTGADATANVTLNLQAGTGTLGGTLSKAAVAGVADFTGLGVNIDLMGVGKVLRATKADTTGSDGTVSTLVDSNSFEISAPIADHITITTQPVNTVAGEEIVVIAEIRDVTDTLITTGPDATANVTLSVNSGTGVLGGTVTVSAVGGVIDFTGQGANIDLIGLKDLTLSKADMSGSGGAGVVTVDTSTFSITHAPAAQLTFSTQPADPTAVLEDLLPVIQVLDSFGNLVDSGADATANVTLTLKAGTGTLGGTTSIAAVGGVATFTATEAVDIDDIGSGKVLRATKADTTGSGGTVSVFTDSAAFEIVADGASQLVFTTQPADPTVAGSDLLPVIEIQDSNGFAVTTGPDATANITLSLQSGTGTLGGTVTIAAVNGVATFTATEGANIDLVGAKVLRATKEDTSGSGGTASYFVDSVGFNINHAPAQQMVFTAQPAEPTGSGDEIPAQLEIRDVYGNIVDSGADATANVTMSIQAGTGALGGTVTVAAVGGVVDFTGSGLNYDTAEVGVVLRATKEDTTGSGGTVSNFVDSNSFTVTFPPATQLVFTTEPADPTAAGAVLIPVIEIRDGGGNPIIAGPDATANITLTIQSGTGTLSGTVTVAAVNGVATFTATEGVNIDLIGAKTLRASKEDTSGSGGTEVLTVDSASFNISHAAASQLAFDTEPADPTEVLADLLPIVHVLDSYGNLVSTGADATADITLSLQAGTGVLGGTLTLTAVGGIATFTATEGLNINDVGAGKVIRATKEDTSGSGGTASVFADSTAFSIVTGAASQLVFTTQPADPTGAGQDLLPVIEIQDSNGFVVTSGPDATADITLSLQSGTGPLNGTVTLAAVAGIANFTATESVDIVALDAKVIRATKENTSGSGGTTSFFVDSAGFNITHGPATQLVMTTSPADPTSINTDILIDFEIQDAYNNIVTTGADATANVTISLQAGTGSLSGSLSKSATAGSVSFTATESVQLDTAGTGKVIRGTKVDTTGGGGTVSVFVDSAPFEIITVTPPTGLTLLNPAVSPANDTTPEITVSGVTSGNTVTIYSDSSCSGSVIASGVAGGGSINLTASPALSDGNYTFYANQDDGGNTSACSSASVDYSLITTPPATPSLLVLYDPISSPATDDTPTIQVSGVSSGHTVRLFRDSSCTTEVGSGVATGGSIQITSSALPADAVYNFYAEAEYASLTSSCSTATVQYELDSTLIPIAEPTSLTLYDPVASPGNDPTPIIEVGGVIAGDTVFLYTDSSCTTQVGFNTSTSTTVLIQSSTLPNAVYDFYATRDNDTGAMSACSTATVEYVVAVTPPSAPTGLSLHSPTISPSNDSTPTILVSGVNAGNTIKLFTDSGCSTQVASSTATGTAIHLTSSVLTEAVYDFYALQSNGGVDSPCSTATVEYEYSESVTIPDPPTSLALSSPSFSPDVDTTPTITVNGVDSGDTVKLFTDSNCATEVASGVATGTSIDLTTSTLSLGIYKIYANRTDTTPETSNCSTAYVDYEATDTIQLDDFEGGLGNWTNVGGDDQDWTVNSGGTPSNGIGPDSGFGGAGQYVYTEASSPVAADEIFNLESNSLDAGTNNLAVSFKWNKRGDNMGNLYLEVSTDGGTNWDSPVWTHLGRDVVTSGTHTWKNGYVDLCGLGYDSGNIKLRFRAKMPSNGNVWNSDIAVDQIRIYNSSCNPPLSVAVADPSTNFTIDRTNVYSYPISGTCSQNGGSIEISGEVSTSTTCFSNTWSTNIDFTSVPDGPINLSIRHIFGTQEGSTTLALTKDTSIIQSDDFESGLGNWANVGGDDRDWTRNSGGTPSSGVGPDNANLGSFYMYTEASSPVSNGQTFFFQSNSLDAGSDNLEVNFAWNKRGNFMGDLYLEVSPDGGTNWYTLWSHLGVDVAQNGTAVWNQESVDACAAGYNTGNVLFRFRAVMPASGTVWHSDIAIDSVVIKDGDCL